MLRAGVGNLGLGVGTVFLGPHLRQSEVENLGVPAPGDEDVRRLDVAMNDALAVRRIQRVGHFGREIEQQFVLHRTPADAMLQRHAVEKLHDHEDAAVFLADVVNGADVGMIQRRSRARLAAKTLQRSRIARHIVRQKLERDKASQARVLGLVDDTHAAAAELFDNAVVRDGGVDHDLGAGRMMPDDRALAGGSQFVLDRSFTRQVNVTSQKPFVGDCSRAVFYLAGLVGGDFFKLYAVTFDSDTMRVFLQN